MGGQDQRDGGAVVKVPAFRYPPPDCDALWYALRMHRQVDPKTWPTVLREVPEQFRQAVETYLRGIAHRMRVANAARATENERRAIHGRP